VSKTLVSCLCITIIAVLAVLVINQPSQNHVTSEFDFLMAKYNGLQSEFDKNFQQANENIALTHMMLVQNPEGNVTTDILQSHTDYLQSINRGILLEQQLIIYEMMLIS
jgi:hypothetical protein